MSQQVYQGRIVEKPWGYELIWAHTDRYVGKILHIKKGESLSYQYHRVKDETIRDKAQSWMETEPDAKYRKKYATLWKKK
jgi:hypothetical protein